MKNLTRPPKENWREHPSFVTEHPWMTFFLVLAGLKAVETVARGYEAPFKMYEPPSSNTRANERGRYGDGDTAC